MSIELSPLPYEKNALEPYISEKTVGFHYDKHHAGYVKKLNGLIDGSSHANQDLETIVRSSSGAIFNNAAQIWNHSFYWASLSDQHNQAPDTEITEALNKHFGSVEQFKAQFTERSLSLFGSGWCWLVYDPEAKKLEIVNTANAETPLTTNKVPLLTCDVWEHAYYLDTQNLRPKYLDNYWALVNWQFVSHNLQQSGYQDG